MEEFFKATSVVNTKKGLLWNRKTNNNLAMLLPDVTKKFDKSDFSPNEQAEQELSLNDLLEQLEILAHAETRPAVKHLKGLLSNLGVSNTAKCTLNRILLKGRVELKLERAHVEHLHFRATNALYLSASELQISQDLCFDVAIVDDGLVLSNVKGLSVNVHVLKGISNCEVIRARIQSKDDQGILKLQTHNPLIGDLDDDNFIIELETDPSADSDEDDNDASKANLILEKREKAKHLRSTYTGLTAFSVLNDIARPFSLNATGESLSTFPAHLRAEYLKLLSIMYAVSLAFAASYLYLMSTVPYLVSIVMTLCAASFFLLGFESRWTFKAKLAISLNAISLAVVIIKLFSYMAGTAS